MRQQQKIRIGDLLIAEGAITEHQLQSALAKQKESGQRLGRVLTDLGFVDEDQMLTILSQQLEIPFVDLRHFDFNIELVKRLPETMARRFRALTLKEVGRDVLVGLVDPMDIFAVDEISRALKQPVRPAVVRESELMGSLDILYRRTDEIDSLAGELEEELGDDTDFYDINQLTSEDEDDTPVVKLLQSIFEDAMQVKASDIHIEPDETELRIRQRVDGVLHEHVMKEKRIASALVLRLKLLSGLNISEKRLPQDGRFNLKIKGRSVDVRLSTMPVQHGEAVVMRLLDQSSSLTNLANVGMNDKVLADFRALIHRPHGLILVTGPTGSGKTTTLYGALSELNTPATKIITAEDPVEYRLPRINQVQIRADIGLTFGAVLRVALRQDPDIVLIGEIRDNETAEIALKASMTGHLVLSTLHTNDAVSSAIRLMDMGAEGYLVAVALNAVVAQRLIRRACEYCKVPYTPSPVEQHWLQASVTGDGTVADGFVMGEGCSRCNHTGYMGRIGIFEVLTINGPMASALRANDPERFARLAAADESFRPLRLSALDYARQGVTTLEEVARVTEHVEDLGEPLPLLETGAAVMQPDDAASSGVALQ